VRHVDAELFTRRDDIEVELLHLQGVAAEVARMDDPLTANGIHPIWVSTL
jgi:hypothetical protein